VNAPSPLSGNPLLAIFAVSEALVSSTGYSEVLANLAARIGESMNVMSCDILTYDAEHEAFTFDALWSAAGVSASDRARVGRIVRLRDRPDLREIIQSQDMVERHVKDPGLPADAREAIAKWGYKSMLEVPLHAGGELLGVVGVQESRFARRFTQTERDLLGWLCELAALGIHNARMMRREQERSRQLAAIVAMDRALTTAGDDAKLDAALTSAAVNALGATHAAIHECDAAATPIGLDQAVLAGREPLVHHASDVSLPGEVRADLARTGEKTRMSVPIIFADEPLGVLILAWTDDEHPATAEELSLARCMSCQAAILLRNRRLRRGAP
jgi:transcriptional regulator with GAF, ATPase, and Fis domain